MSGLEVSANAFFEKTIPIAYDAMGIRFVDVRPGFCAAEVPFEGNGNHLGTMYAGVLFTVGEVLGGGMAVASFDLAGFLPLVKEMTIRYLKPARTRIRAEASLDAEVVAATQAAAQANGKADYVIEGTLTDEDGVVVATTSALCQLRKVG